MNHLGPSQQPWIHDYGTDFGTGYPDAANYSALSFALQLDRARNLFIWKLPLPMLVPMTNWLALLLRPGLVEVRTAMPATALLTTGFLRQSSLAALAQVFSLLLDYTYVLAYCLIVVRFAQMIWDNNRIGLDDASASPTCDGST